MKKLLFLLLPIAAMILNSCSKDEGGDGLTDNKVTINGQTHQFVGGWMGYHGHVYSEYYENVDLYLELPDDYIIYIETGIPNGNTKLLPGTYTYMPDEPDGSSGAFTFWEVEIEVDNDLRVTGGTITVAVSGDTYTITLNCTTNNGGTVKGRYKGSLELS